MGDFGDEGGFAPPPSGGRGRGRGGGGEPVFGPGSFDDSGPPKPGGGRGRGRGGGGEPVFGASNFFGGDDPGGPPGGDMPGMGGGGFGGDGDGFGPGGRGRGEGGRGRGRGRGGAGRGGEAGDFRGPPGLFQKGDWDCPSCGNINWERRATCNKCNTAKPNIAGVNERRDGAGGGFNERQERAAAAGIEIAADGYDDFGRRIKKQSADKKAKEQAALARLKAAFGTSKLSIVQDVGSKPRTDKADTGSSHDHKDNGAEALDRSSSRAKSRSRSTSPHSRSSHRDKDRDRDRGGHDRDRRDRDRDRDRRGDDRGGSSRYDRDRRRSRSRSRSRGRR